MNTTIRTELTAKSRKAMHDCDPKGLHANWAKAQTVDFCKKSIAQSVAMLTYVSKSRGKYSTKGAEDVTDAKGVLAAYKQLGTKLGEAELNAVAYQLDRYAVRLYNRGTAESREALRKACGIEAKAKAPAKPGKSTPKAPAKPEKSNEDALLNKLSELVTVTKATAEQVQGMSTRLDSVEQRLTALETRKKPGPKPGSKRNTTKETA